MKKISIVFMAICLLADSSNIYAQIALYEENQKQMVMTKMSSIPLAFTENQGQWEEKTLFNAETGGVAIHFCSNEVAYLFVRDTDELLEDDRIGPSTSVAIPDEMNRPSYKKESMLIKVQFIGANSSPEIVGIDRMPHNNNYFCGNDPSKWRANIPNYSSIIYKDIWPGIDLKYYGNGKSMKYDFVVHSGADLSQIAIHYSNVEDISISHNGDLKMSTRFGLVYETKPYVYHDIDGRKTEVEASYCLEDSGVVGFAVSNYNPSLPLIIDPELVYSTYLGGDNYEYSWGIAVDAAGSAYLTGYTNSLVFPMENPYDSIYSGGEYDVYVMKLSPAGDSLVYSTYLGGLEEDRGTSIAVDASGNAYVTGWTYSSDFPTENPYDGDHNGGNDVFVHISAVQNSEIGRAHV